MFYSRTEYVCFGRETAETTRQCGRSGWQDGNSAAALETLDEKCDVLIVATSSYNEGDPPDNFLTLFANLLKVPQQPLPPS